MIFTPQQINEMLDLIDAYFIRYGVSNISSEYLTKQEEDILKKFGISTVNKINAVDDSFRYGILSEALENTKGMTYRQVKQAIMSKNFLPLTAPERAALDAARYYAYSEIKGLGNRVKSNANNIAIEVDRAMRTKYEKVIQTESVQAIMKREGMKQLSSRLGNATQDWSRDFDRMADYIMHRSHSEGRAFAMERQDPNAQVHVHVQSTACNHCRRLYLNSDNTPKIFSLAELRANGTNVGRKVAQWKPVLPPAHPWCMLPEAKVLTNNGWKELKEIKGTELIMSVNYEAGTAEWVAINKIIDYEYEGKMHKWSNKTFEHTVTSNHRLPVKFIDGYGYSSQKVDNWNLIASEELPKDKWKILRTIESWNGKNIDEVTFGDLTIKGDDYIKLIAWFLSEGSVVRKNQDTGLWELSIAQSREKNPENYNEISSLMKRVFGDVWEGNMILSITSYNQSLYGHLKAFGHSMSKSIPLEILEAPIAQLELFLDTYVMGDGCRRKSKAWKGGNFKDEIVVYTSSSDMVSDLCELILKMGLRPSVHTDDGGVSTHKNGDYVSKPVHSVRICRSQYAHSDKLNKEELDYKGRVMCLELEKNHNFFVMENGKVTNTGNCYCEVEYKSRFEEWNPESQRFEIKLTEGAKKLKEKYGRVIVQEND